MEVPVIGPGDEDDWDDERPVKDPDAPGLDWEKDPFDIVYWPVDEDDEDDDLG